MLLKDVSGLARGSFRGSRTVVIGAGAVGLHVAIGLGRLGHDVVVVESGGVELGEFPPETYRSIGLRHEGIRLARSRSLGGTTNLWGGQLVEFQRVDFDGRDWMPGSKWPVASDEVLPYYRRTYEALGIPPDVQEDGRVWAGIRAARPRLEEEMEVFLTRWLKIPSFAAYYAGEIERRESPRVLLGHTAVAFLGTRGELSGIRVVAPDGRSRVVEGDRFVLAAGTIESVRLLLHAAASGDGECPWRDNPLVGACFQDHLGGKIADLHPEDSRAFFDTFSNVVWSSHRFQPKWRFTDEALGRRRLLSIHGMVGFDSPISENLQRLKRFAKTALYGRRVSGARDFLVDLRACGKYLLPIATRYARDHRIFVPSTSRTSLRVQAEQRPVVDSRIRTDPAVLDAMGLPRVILDWRLSGEELESIREFAVRSDRALRAAGLARLEIDERLLRRDPRFLATLNDQYHQAGGAIMGSSPRDGVVDRNLRVFGTRNLYVAGAATFRTSSGANTTFTALAFATRLVDHLHRSHEAPPFP